MGVLFGGFQCLSPQELARDCANASPPIPTDLWYGKANRFTCPLIGLKPGYGHLLLPASVFSPNELDQRLRLNPNARRLLDNGIAQLALELAGQRPRPSQIELFTPYDKLTLKFTDAYHDSAGLVNRSLELPNIRIIGTPLCITPGDPRNGVYLVEIADRRVDCEGLVNLRYNFRAFPDADYEPYSLNGAGDPWSWERLLNIIWDLVGNLGDFPDLPAEIAGLPQQIDGHGVRAADLLEDLLAVNNMAVSYNPVEDEFGIVYFASDKKDALFDQAQREASGQLIWDEKPAMGGSPPIPKFCRVVFPIFAPAAANLGAATYVVDVAQDSTILLQTLSIPNTRTIRDSAAIQQDILPVRIKSNGTVVTESADDALERAQDVAYDFFYRALYATTKFHPISKVYSGLVFFDAFINHETANKLDLIAWEDVGDGVKTRIMRAGIQGFPPLFFAASSLAYTNGELVPDEEFDSFTTIPQGISSVTPERPFYRAGNIPPSQVRFNNSEHQLGGMLPASGRSIGPMLKRAGPLRQWDTATVGRTSIDPAVARLWRERPRAQYLTFVKIDATSATGGLYAATEWFHTPSTDTWTEGEAVWYKNANRTVPTLGNYHLVTLVGQKTTAGVSKKVYQDAAGAGGGSSCGSGMEIFVTNACPEKRTFAIVRDGLGNITDITLQLGSGAPVTIDGLEVVTALEVERKVLQFDCTTITELSESCETDPDDCCPGPDAVLECEGGSTIAVPQRLFLNFTNKTGTATCLPDSLEMLFDDNACCLIAHVWVEPSIFGDGGICASICTSDFTQFSTCGNGGGFGVYFYLACTGAGQISYTTTAQFPFRVGGLPPSGLAATTNPLFIDMGVLSLVPFYGVGTARVTVTE